ncbi:FAD binding domain-containing protein [Streptomyces sp. ACA25]|uniref:FAD binding domain-containing protein n=1 Tax=Streptomyces sp. ACA25 TaxID=3022596 RepID=UPI002307218D|nr:FAD binding domain-containing protein [Streptomyces sp. ACA25]MDB1089209.1 FAD binding domain-containing protein [Streptomyces sp. ACA25]
MDFLRPAGWEEALEAKAAHPGAVPLAGGTDVMVEINFDRRRPEHLLDLERVSELHEWETGAEYVRLGAAVPYTRIIENLRHELPGLAMAARTVGSPQIRNRGSVGGNLGAASPAGDAHPALLSAGSRIEAASVRGSRLIPVEDFFTGVKRNALAADELIRAVHIKRATGPQQFSKVGTRNAMVIAVCAFGIALHPDTRTVRTGIGSAAPTPVRARVAEDFLNAELGDGGFWESGRPLPPAAARQFGELAAGACNPIDDARGTAAYRRHAVSVMARRTLGWAWESYRGHRPAQRGDRPCG